MINIFKNIKINNYLISINFYQLKNLNILNKTFKIYNCLQLCKLNSIQIPRFCYHEKLKIAGNCRMLFN